MTEPFLLRGGDHGVLLLHGFTGSPGEMRGLGELLATADHTVLCPRLPGHTGRPDDLAAATWRDWLASAQDGYAYLAARCPTVSVVGFSLGGALAIMLATRVQPHRLVVLSTPSRLQGDWRINLLAVVRHTTPWFYPLERADLNDPAVRAEVAKHAPDADLDDPEVQALVRREARISLHAVDEARLAFAAAQAALPLVRVPTLVMQGRADNVAPAESPAKIAARIGTPHCEIVWWDDTGHQMLVTGPHRQQIYARVAAFLA